MTQAILNQKSELETLLEKNAYTEKGLTKKEMKRTAELINSPEYSEKNCWICEGLAKNNKNYEAEKAIYDTGMCKGHATYALLTRK